MATVTFASNQKVSFALAGKTASGGAADFSADTLSVQSDNIGVVTATIAADGTGELVGVTSGPANVTITDHQSSRDLTLVIAVTVTDPNAGSTEAVSLSVTFGTPELQ